MDRNAPLTKQRVLDLIEDGQAIVIYKDDVLKLDKWLYRHPGGRLAILHMVGTDATDEIEVFHSAATLATMKRYRIGRKPMGPWINVTPPIRRTTPDASASDASKTPTRDGDVIVDCGLKIKDNKDCPCFQRKARVFDDEEKVSPKCGLTKADYTKLAVQGEADRDLEGYPSLEPKVQEDIIRKFRKLHERVYDEKYYDTPYLEYGKEMVRYTALFVAFIVALRHGWYMTSASFLGLFWHQIMFTAHDAGHRAITHNFVADTLIGIFIADFCCGLSIGWWKSSHNVHHLVTNSPEHDPDIQNVPLFSTSPKYFQSIMSSYYDGFVFAWDAFADFMIPYQCYTYYPIMAIARFNLYLLSWLHLISNKSSGLGGSKARWVRPTEIACMTGYWFVFGYLLLWCSLPTWTVRVAFVLVSHIVTMPLHVQITLSHWGMSTSDLGEAESFPQRQLRTTMDVACPQWLDFVHGGLQFQAVHHLFPRVPRHNLRKLQNLVREFCRDTDIKYSILGFADANRHVMGRLDEVAEQVRILVSCQVSMSKE